ncbi:hypothetical protein HOK15_02790 [Candidatus Falkowbacteria bacterium]|jgi:hypothetical protein|nr:hypothetical protein [Candidatus Falkowbacteria bacterium]MBT5503113.1 hypothetical protein [Candidatus Falkowbacteria bacterium]MBT6573907.1 hypothetical protein [Candidatus Falkowbacteria bacterium]
MIVQAAIRHEGQVYTGRRHIKILEKMIRVHRIRKAVSLGDQGFLNDDSEFLTRQEAAKEALECGQIDEMPIGGKLNSEMLW